ncbi:ABC transporter substrate-binding protein [Rubrivivax gelatinosus]|uniref:ABC transporter substrate-binding protein n=1 Tax=Rubrivivax gelatinosus TaxID=28068 RepID=UPI001902C974|nr:ABC transporter substrate-binding protein [Rubrivivax gelatinosus]MBK1613450.1 ABC transporter substrate-binding protein [Rubrivivax gelatinosus]
MSLDRRSFNTLLAGLPLAGAVPAAMAQAAKKRLVLGMVLEPPGLDPTVAAAAAIGEIVHYNVLEGLTKIAMDGRVLPLLAASWTVSPDGRSYVFKLRRGVTFSDGAPFDAAAVKWSFERAKAEGSTNKAKKAVFDNIARITVENPLTLILTLDSADPTLLFRLGESPAVILHPASAANAATRPVGTGPFRVEDWKRGASVTLAKWPGHRDAARVALERVVFRFINDPAAQVSALLAGDVDAMPRFAALQALPQLRADRRFVVEVGNTAGKGILALNNRRKPLDDPRVRRALTHAIDRQAFIAGAQEGLGKPIGSHFAPTDAGYVELSGLYPHDPARARALLKEAGVTTPLRLTLTLPPPPYARKGGEIVAAMLAQVGVVAKIENVEWAQWLSGAFKGSFDLTLINHVEPLDYATAYADPKYYFGYDSVDFRRLVARHAGSHDAREKTRLWREIQRKLADDAVNVFLWNPAQVAVWRKGLRGLWSSSPIFANDLAAVSWGAA